MVVSQQATTLRATVTHVTTTRAAVHLSTLLTHHAKDLPNVNEMTWYAAKGDPRWDADELWTTMGHLYKGGMWFKKKAHINGYKSNTAVDAQIGEQQAKTNTGLHL